MLQVGVEEAGTNLQQQKGQAIKYGVKNQVSSCQQKGKAQIRSSHKFTFPVSIEEEVSKVLQLICILSLWCQGNYKAAKHKLVVSV